MLQNGDFLSPCTLTALDGGRAMTSVLNEVSIDFVCLGNHELDLSLESLHQKMNKLHGQCLNSNLLNPPLDRLPSYAAVNVGDRIAVFGGFLTDDMSIYAPSTKPEILPVPNAILDTLNTASTELGYTPDLFVPLTHQDMERDIELAQYVTSRQELCDRVPVILGGHEHDLIEEEVNTCTCTCTCTDTCNTLCLNHSS